MDDRWLGRQAQVTLNRLMPRLDERFLSFKKSHPEDWSAYCHRLGGKFPQAFPIALHFIWQSV